MVLAAHESVEENTKNTCKSSTTMNNAEIQAYKKVEKIGPRQGPVGPISNRKSSKSESSEDSPVQITRPRSESGKNSDEQRKRSGVSSDGPKRSPVQIKKTRSLSSHKGTNEISSVQLRKVKSDSAKALYDSKREQRKTKTMVQRKFTYEEMKELDDKKDVDELKKDVEGVEESPIGNEMSSPIGVSNEGQIQIMTAPSNADSEEEEEGVDKEIEVDVERKNLDVINVSVEEEEEPKKLVIKHAKIHPIEVSDNFHGTPSKLQSFGDLIMWRDVSRSAFVFGIGAFAIISSSFTGDLNISFISVLSYFGLVYLGTSFIFISLVSRRSDDMDKANQEYVVGEEEAVWVVKLILPYLNEFLLKLRSLFSGDPATTMKLAAVLFILARYGGSITIWKMTKLGFFGVFVVPKLCSSYSSHLAAYGTFWIRRFGDAWESCSNKKAVGFGVFALVWNLSSVVARIWAAFILFVAFKYYQQWWVKEEGLRDESIAANSISKYTGGQVPGRRSTLTEMKKTQKRSHVLDCV